MKKSEAVKQGGYKMTEKKWWFNCPYCHPEHSGEPDLVAKRIWSWSKQIDDLCPYYIGADIGYSAICKQSDETYMLMTIDGDEYLLSSFPINYCPVCGRKLHE